MNSQDELKLYKLVDVHQPPPQPIIQQAKLTMYEVNIKNRAYRMNGTTLKYIPVEQASTNTTE